MAFNPYAPPTSPPTSQKTSPSSIGRAIFTGIGCDILGSGVSYAALDFLYDTGRDHLEFGSSALPHTVIDNYSLFFDCLTISAGFGFSMLGGFIGARLLHTSNRRAALIQAGITVGLGLPLQVMQFSLIPVMLLMSRTFAGVMLGAMVGNKLRKRPARH